MDQRPHHTHQQLFFCIEGGDLECKARCRTAWINLDSTTYTQVFLHNPWTRCTGVLNGSNVLYFLHAVSFRYIALLLLPHMHAHVHTCVGAAECVTNAHARTCTYMCGSSRMCYQCTCMHMYIHVWEQQNVLPMHMYAHVHTCAFVTHDNNTITHSYDVRGRASCMRRSHLRDHSTYCMDKASHPIAFYNSPHLPVTSVQLMPSINASCTVSNFG